MQAGDRPDPFRIAGGLLFFCFHRAHSGAQAQNFRKLIVHLQQTTRRGHPTGRFYAHVGAYQRTVSGADLKALNFADASDTANTSDYT